MKYTTTKIKQSILLAVIAISTPHVYAMGEDDPFLGKLMVNQIETRVNKDGPNTTAWEVDAWLGKDFHKLWLKTEGERLDGINEDTENQLLYSRAITPFWDFQIGARHDTKPGLSRNYGVIGLQGLSPYLFEVDSSLSFGKNSQVKINFSAEYEVMLSQKWVLTPEVDINFHTKDDIEFGVGSGLSDMEFGLRLRYEIKREFAPYIGVNWSRSFGKTARLLSDEGEDSREFQFVAGVRMWF